MEIFPIAHIHNCYTNKFGIPRQSGRVMNESYIVFTPEYRSDEALRGIESFSHLWLIFDFSEAHRDEMSLTVRPPRLGGNKRVGVFASRSPFRPNNLGLSSVKLERTEKREKDGNVLVVLGADLLDGTPIYDIKPYIPYTDAHPDAVGGYAEEHKGHKLKLKDDGGILNSLPQGLKETVIACIEDDPRPSYIDDDERVFGLDFDGYDIRFTVKCGTAEIISAGNDK